MAIYLETLGWRGELDDDDGGLGPAVGGTVVWVTHRDKCDLVLLGIEQLLEPKHVCLATEKKGKRWGNPAGLCVLHIASEPSQLWYLKMPSKAWFQRGRSSDSISVSDRVDKIRGRLYGTNSDHGQVFGSLCATLELGSLEKEKGR